MHLYHLTVLYIQHRLAGLTSSRQRGCVPFWRLSERICFLAHSDGWWCSVPCSSRNELPIPLLAVSEGCSLPLEFSCILGLMAPSSGFKASRDETSFSHIRSSHVSSSIASLCLTLLPSSSTFKGSTQTIQDNILIQRSITLIPSTMSLLLCNVTYTALTSGIRA